MNTSDPQSIRITTHQPYHRRHRRRAWADAPEQPWGGSPHAKHTNAYSLLPPLDTKHIGIVLATPNFLKSLAAEGIADKELSALLATDRVIPVVHGLTYEELREESPLLASRSGLSTGEDTLEQIAVKIANAVRPETD